MSKTVDQRVVEMRFDNSQFESNVKTSMSTLERLKQALKLPGASKSLEGVSSAAKKVDFSGMSKGIETVNAQFSNMQVIGMTALSNITTAAMQAGSNLVKSFTIDPILNGFQEYELQMNSVQTILANTASKGTTMAQVTAALDELNEYADMTIYNFGEMTKNIGTFTAAGVDLDKSVAAIKGIANLGAMSGSTSQQVSTAMYQLSQALAAGRVSLMDWNSVVNAGMGGEQFQNALKRTAENMGHDVDGLIKKYGSFRESLTRGQWLTADVLTETLNQISGAYTEAELIEQGYTAEQARAITEMATTATDAATKVKTFTQLMSTLSEAAGSGWAKSFQLILGDFEEAKEFFTNVSDYLSEIINNSSDSRNNLLAGAFDSNWKKLTQEVEAAGVPLDTFTDKLKQVAKEAYNIDLDAKIEEFGSLEKAMQNIPQAGDIVISTLKAIAGTGTDLNKSTEAMTDKLNHFQEVVDDVWIGSYKNGEDRIKALTDAGYDYAEVQDLVNKVESGRKLTLDDLNETQMKAIGFTDEQVEALKKLSVEAETSGTSINELINNLNKPSGRQLFLETILNTLKAIIEPARAVARAFGTVFAIDSSQLYNAIEALHRFSEAILMDEESLDKLTRTFKGVFGVIKIFTTLISGGLGLAFNVLTTVLEHFNLGILDVTAFIGDILYAFTDFITSGEVIKSVIEGIVGVFQNAGGPISEFVNKLKELPAIQSTIETIKEAFKGLFDYIGRLSDLSPTDALKKVVDDIKNALSGLSWEDFLAGLSGFGEKVRAAFSEAIAAAQTVGPDIIAGLQNGLSGGVEKILGIMRDIGTKIIEAIKAVLGIQSPSTEMIEVGRNIIEGLIEGLNSLLSGLWDFIKGIADGIKEVFSDIDWGSILMVGMAAGILVVFYKIASALEAIASPFEGIGDVLESATGVLDAFAGTLKGLTLKVKAEALKSLATAIAILVGSIAVLTFLDIGKVWNAVAVITVLAGVLTALSVAIGRISVGGVLDSAKIAGMMLSLGVSLLAIAAVMKIISSMSWEDMGKAAIGIVGIGAVVAGIIAVSNIGNEKDMENAAKLVGKIGVSLLLMAGVAKLISTMSWEDLGKAGVGMAGMAVIVAGLVAISKMGGKQVAQSGYVIQKIAVAMLLLAATAKLISGMSWGDMAKAGVGLAGLVAIVTALIYITKYAGKEIGAIGTTIIAIAGAMALLAVTARLISGMSWGDMGKAAVGLAGLAAIVSALVYVTQYAGEKLDKAGSTILMLSLAIGILAGVAVLLGLVKTENLVRGIAAVTALAAIVAALTYVTQYAGDAQGTLIGLSVAIGVMAAALVALSFIDTGKLAGATIALSAVMAMFALLVKSTEHVGKAMGTIIVMTVAIGLLGALLYILAGLPIESTLGAALALSTLLLAMSAALKILDGVGKVSGSALASMAVLTLVMAGIGAVLGLLSYFNVEPSLQTVAALSVMLLAMSGVCLILSNIQSVSPMALVAMGALTLVVGGLAIILGLMSYFDVAPSLETALSLSVLLLAMSGAMVILSAIGAAAPAAIAGAASMVAVVGIIAAAVAAFGAIKQIPGVDWLVSEGGAFLQNLGNAIGQFVGGIAGGALEGLTGSLPEVADNLTDFINRLQPFIDGISGIDPSITESIGNLAAAILLLTGASFLEAITSFITGGSSLSDFAEQLVPFGTAMKNYSNEVTGIDAEAVTASAIAAKALGELANNLPKEGGLTQAIFGETTGLDEFGTQLVAFGNGLRMYSTAVTGLDIASIQNSVTAAQALSDLAATLPKEGGLAQAIFGEVTDMGTFGTQLALFGSGLRMYSIAVSGIDIESIQNSAAAGQALSQLAATLPKEGGLAQAIFGEATGMDEFGSQLVTFGYALRSYSTSVSSLEVGPIQNSVAAGRALAQLADELPDDPGWISNFLGGKDNLSGFGDTLTTFGTALSTYAVTVSGIDFSSISSSVSGARSIVNFVKDNVEADMSGIENIKKIDQVGDAISTYASRVAGIEFGSVNSSISAIRQLMNVITSMVGMDISGVATFKAAIDQLATVNIAGMVAAFQAAAVQMVSVGLNIMNNLASGILAGQGVVLAAITVLIAMVMALINSKAPGFTNAGRFLVTSLSNGVQASMNTLRSAFTVVLASAVSAVRGYYYSFYSAGSYISSGLAAGMRSALSQVRAAADELAAQAARATAARAEVQSPSRVFYRIGSFMGEGLVNALDDYQRISYKAGYGVADSASSGLSKAISKVGDLLESDIDMNPKISPVLDLSNIENGVGNLSNLLNTTGVVDMIGNAGVINGRMNQRIQNGTSFSDVVGAIDKLRRDVSEISQPSYIVEGITYDGGTAVSTAIEDLVRATRIERRV